MKCALAFLLLLSGLLACGTRAGPDVMPAPGPLISSVDTPPLPASLVRRLAEAADGYRDGNDKWVVASRKAEKGNHRVAGVFDTFQKRTSLPEGKAPSTLRSVPTEPRRKNSWFHRASE